MRKKTWKKHFIILGWTVIALTTNPEAIKILHDIKHHCKIQKKNTNPNDKMGEMLAIYHRQRFGYLAYNHLLEIGKKKTPK